jgi:hypothetical protein
MIGILTSEEISEKENLKKEKEEADRVYETFSDIMNEQPLFFNKINNNSSTAKINPQKKLNMDEKRSKTGRFNETRASNFSRKTSRKPNSRGKFILCVEEAEREIWVKNLNI